MRGGGFPTAVIDNFFPAIYTITIMHRQDLQRKPERFFRRKEGGFMSAKEQLREETRTRVRVPRQYQVLIYNDDFTPMDFVVQILMEIFGKQEEEAVALMLSIHKGSSAVAGVYPKDIARTKAREAVDWAREEGFPLKVEAVSL